MAHVTLSVHSSSNGCAALSSSTDTQYTLSQAALAHLSKEIRSATTSMTSVPKPLKFLRPHYAALKTVYDGMVSKSSAGGAGGEENRKALADIMSILAMTMAAPGTRDR
jgi:26S proteasome regulatory subunit N1